MFCQQDAVVAISTHKHLPYILSFYHQVVNTLRWQTLVFYIGLHNHFISLSEGPDFAVLEVDMFEVLLADVLEFKLFEIESVLECYVILLEAKHAI